MSSLTAERKELKAIVWLGNSAGIVKYNTRAKYYPSADGLRLASIQTFSGAPRFAPCSIAETFDVDGHVAQYAPDPDDQSGDQSADEVDDAPNMSDIARATRRAKINAFDKIACNSDMVMFSTLTYDPDRLDGDRASYDDVYHVLRPWLSNLVQRHGFKYVIAPERHKSGGIHFHMISNVPEALRKVRAYSPYTGKPLSHNGRALYNLDAWTHGFSSAEMIGADRLDRDRVAKYIFKYMGKQLGAKVGGRYLLSGGQFVRPVYVYGDKPEEFVDDGQIAKFGKIVELDCGVTYQEIGYI